MLAYHALTAINIALMALLAFRTPQPFFRVYLVCMAIAAGLQNTRWWNLAGEVVLAVFSVMWLLSELPKGRRAVTEALSLGLFVAAVLMLLVPKPWPNYPPAMYFLRLYSSAVCIGIATPLAVLDARKVLTIAWFSAVMLAGSQRGWNYVAVAVTCNAAWTAILMAWLMFSRHRDTCPASS